MRTLGLDVGDKRIGVAISDRLGLIAHGMGTIDRKNCTEVLRKIVEDNEVTALVVGIPRMLNGSLGVQGEKVMQFVEELKKALPVHVGLWDERLSTVSAEKALLEADLSRKKRKGLRDKVSAVLILQNYLDSIEK